jgi:hypothetical protein
MDNENNQKKADQAGRVLFTFVLFALAALHTIRQVNVDTLSVTLGVIAVVPWILPQLFGMISSLSVTGLFEVKFKELQQTIAQQQHKIDGQEQEVQAHRLALEEGVGGVTAGDTAKRMTVAAGGAVAQSAEAGDIIQTLLESQITAVGGAIAHSPDAGEARHPASGDPKGKYGSKPSSGFYQLRAAVKPFPGSDRMFLVHAWVEATDARHHVNKVIFDVGPTFPQREVEVTPNSDGIAFVDRAARGAFTIGAKVFWGPPSVPPVRLELDLATDVSDAPSGWLKSAG